MTEGDLSTVRAAVRQQQTRAVEIERRRKALLGSEDRNGRSLTLRCTKGHGGGKQPMVAEVQATSQGTFFHSTLPWARSDAGQLRPWVADVYLARVLTGSSLDDDELLSNALDNLAEMRKSGPGDLSWIADRAGRAHQILEVIDLPFAEGRIPLWVRCPLHLEDFEVVDPRRLVDRLR
ncbi:hypothetical protein [Nocardioides scoriae]|uniref:hypothetical protein n=1 Tax=Nocardioides scoriae TaxID=642780 RepID=UPI0012FBA0BA|nr:hypothetical protein [Nocardioides scoriae]